MDNIEKEIKGRLQHATSSGNIDADDLWNNIENELSGGQNYRKVFLLIFLSLLLGSILISTVVFYYSNSRPKQETKQSQNKLAIEHKQPTTIIPIEESTNSYNKAQSTNPLSSKGKSTEAEPKKSNVIAPKNTILKELNNQASNTKKILTPTKELISIAEKEETINKPRTATSIGTVLPLMPIGSLLSHVTLKEKESIPLNISIYSDSVKSVNKRIQLGLFAASHIIRNQFRTIDKNGAARRDILNEGFNPIIGYAISAEAIIRIRPNLHFQTGIAYFQSTEEFNLTQSWDTTIWRNNIPDTELINAKAIRKVRHNNKHAFISIPLMIGLQRQKGKFYYGVNAGIGLNFLQSQSGKIINSNDLIIAFNDEEAASLPRPSFVVSYRLNPFVAYQFNQKFTIQIRPSFSYYPYGKSSFFDMKYASIFSGLGMGLIYKF